MKYDWFWFAGGMVRRSSITGVFYGDYGDWMVWLALPGASGPTEKFHTKSDMMTRYEEVLDIVRSGEKA